MMDQNEELIASKGSLVGNQKRETMDSNNVSNSIWVQYVKLIGFNDIHLSKVSCSSQVMKTEMILGGNFNVFLLSSKDEKGIEIKNDTSH